MSNAIVARMGLDLRDFRQGLGQAVTTAKASGREIGSALAAGAAALGVGATIGQVIEWADNIQDLSDRYGVSTTALQKWGNVAEQNGSSIEGVASGFNKLIINQDKALAGDEQLIAHFEKLGVSIEDLRAMSPDALMQKIGSGAMNASDLVAVLGKSALELVPALQAVADGSAEFGAVLDAGAIKTLADASDTIKAASTQLKVILGGALVWVADKAQEAGVMIAWLINLSKGISLKDADKIAREQMKEMEDARNNPPTPRKPRDMEETKSAEKAAEKEKKRIQDIRDGEEEQLRKFNMEKSAEADKAADKEKQRIKDIRDGEEEQLRQFRMQQEEDSEKAAKAELARIETEKQARLTAERAVKQERKNQFISDADDPNGRRERNRQRLRDESLGRRFDREEGLRARGGQSSADFNRGDFKDRTKARGAFIGPQESPTQRSLRERDLKRGINKNGSAGSPEADAIKAGFDASETGKSIQWLKQNYGKTV